MKIDISEKEKKPGYSAAYVICEKGTESRYYTEYGGGYARPFNVLDFLYTLSRNIAAASYMNKDYSYLITAPLLEQMRDEGWANGQKNKHLFHVYDKETDPDINDIPFLVMLDIDRNSLGIWFNKNFKEFGQLAGKEIMVSRYSISYDKMLYSADHYKEEHPDISYPECMEIGFKQAIMEHLKISKFEEIKEESFEKEELEI